MKLSINLIRSYLVKILLVTLVFDPKLVDGGKRKKQTTKTTTTMEHEDESIIETTTALTEAPVLEPESPPHLFWRELLERELDEMEDTYAGEPPIDEDAGERTIALLDLKFEVICSGAALTSEWGLTASHCLTHIPKYIKSAISNKIVPVQAVYKHPRYNYEVTLRKDEEGLTDVISLDDDIGLVKTKKHMHLPMMMPTLETLFHEISQIDPQNLLGQMLTVYGFGRHDTEDKENEIGIKKTNAGRGIASALFKSTLMTEKCARNNWYPCVCGVSTTAGICAGDSGGPVFSGQVQIGVASLGPLKCGAGSSKDHGQTVITAIRPYIALINKTVFENYNAQLASGYRSSGVRPQISILSVILLFSSFLL